jgi:threonine dehydratase
MAGHRGARQFLQAHFRPTRLIAATSLNNVPHAQVHLKLESEMPTGSFKVRGALYALHAEMTKRQVAEVVASSTGNHGAAVAHAARLLNVPAKTSELKAMRLFLWLRVSAHCTMGFRCSTA